MNAITKKPKQLTLAVAALAIVAVAAVMLLSGSGPAQATTASLAPDGGGSIDLRPVQQEDEPDDGDPEPSPTPVPRTIATPEPCPGKGDNPNTEAAAVVDSGHVALFDVWWNPEELELTNSSCPPTVSSSDTRSPSNIDIAETVIHIPNSAKVDLSAADTVYTKEKYPDLWRAEALEGRGTDGGGNDVGDGIVWALPACPPDGDLSEVGLCLSFSAALLNAADWVGVSVDDDGDEQGGIVYHLDHIHQIDIDKQDPRYTLAYDAYDAAATSASAAHWNSADARTATMRVEPGGYARPMWFFTSRGTYEFQVHITGDPEQDPTKLGGLDPIAKELSVNDDVREYTIHIGAEADLSVSASVEPALASGDTTLDPGDNVTITINASNGGPSTAPDTKVTVDLPSGLVSPTVDTVTKGTYSDGVWTIGSMCNPAEPAKLDADPPEPECPQTATLTITATVAAETHGQELTVKATISATETVEITESKDGQKVAKEYQVPVLDPNPSNDMNTVTTTVADQANVNPMFRTEATIAENSAAGTAVVGPVLLRDPDDASHTFTIEGTGAGKFQVDNAGNVTVAQGADLNYECQANYNLTLHVSDGKDTDGNTDTEIDDILGLDIQLTDVTSVTVSLTADRSTLPTGQSVHLTATTNEGPPTCTYTTAYQWHEDGSHIIGGSGLTTIYNHSTAGTRSYYLKLVYEEDGVYHTYTSNTIQVTWTDN